ncbi:hypothetical protein GQ53DRAFT_227651 [Thozetella sp. PMI_491]|nr:hypothetical protein GQ53DRAFT_227651 [Thozetella sp. PMI_491]
MDTCIKMMLSKKLATLPLEGRGDGIGSSLRALPARHGTAPSGRCIHRLHPYPRTFVTCGLMTSAGTVVCSRVGLCVRPTGKNPTRIDGSS